MLINLLDRLRRSWATKTRWHGKYKIEKRTYGNGKVDYVAYRYRRRYDGNWKLIAGYDTFEEAARVCDDLIGGDVIRTKLVASAAD